MRWPLVVLGTLLSLILATELVLRVLPVSTATKVDYYIDADVPTYPPHHEWTASTGWDLRNPQHLRANNWGFASDVDFFPDPNAVALIGDSYVESSMLPAGDRPAAQLQSILGTQVSVYGLGSPGTALLDHAQRVRLVSRRLGVKRIVIWLEPADARQTLCSSPEPDRRCLDPVSLTARPGRRASPGWLTRFARHSALAQYLFAQLKLDPVQLIRSTFQRAVPVESAVSSRNPTAQDGQAPAAVSDRSRQVVDAAVSDFFAQIDKDVRDRLLFVVDGRRVLTKAPRLALELERDYLIERLRAEGSEVMDLEPEYARHVARDRRSLEVGPYDRHLNRIGVAIVASRIAQALDLSRPAGVQ